MSFIAYQLLFAGLTKGSLYKKKNEWNMIFNNKF